MHTPSSHATHQYAARLQWTDNLGVGTANYTAYARRFHVMTAGKPALELSADPEFRGDHNLHNPEDLLLAAIAGCHLLSYLALCARHGIRVLSYTDHPEGTLTLDPGGGGQFTRVELTPIVEIAAGDDDSLALRLHETAHQQCFIANSCTVPIRHRATVRHTTPAVRPMRGGES